MAVIVSLICWAVQYAEPQIGASARVILLVVTCFLGVAVLLFVDTGRIVVHCIVRWVATAAWACFICVLIYGVVSPPASASDAPLLHLTYDQASGNFNVYNDGPDYLKLWGAHLDGYVIDLSGPPRYISPKPGSYFIRSTTSDQEILKKESLNGVQPVGFDLFLESAAGHKYTARFLLIVHPSRQAFNIDTQMVGLSSGWPGP